MIEKTHDNVLVDGQPLFPTSPPVREEWAVKYRDPDGVMGAEKWHYTQCSSQQAARNIVSWTHAPWLNREMLIAHRWISDWEIVDG